MTTQSTSVRTVTTPPTIDSPEGRYRVVDSAGLFWGRYIVTHNWARQKYCSYADQDYLPCLGPGPDLLN